MSDKIKVKKVTFNDDLIKNINNLDLNIESKNLEIIKEESEIRKKIAKETESRALNDLELSKKLSNNRSDRISDEIILKEKLTSLEAKVSDLETNGLKSDVNLFEISKEAKYIRDITDAISSKMTEVSSSFTDTQVGNIITSMTNATISGYFENKSNPTNYNNRIIIENLVSNTEDDFSTILKKTGEFTILGEILKSNSVDYNVVPKVNFFSWVVRGALLFDFYSINFISNLVSSLIYHGKNSLKLKYKEIGIILARELTSEIDNKFFYSSGAFIYSWLEFESENKIRNILLGFYQILAIVDPLFGFSYIGRCIPNQVEKLRFYCERNDVSLDSKKKIITDFTYSVVSACFGFEDADFNALIELIDDSFISSFNRDNFMDLTDISPSIVSGGNEAINSKSEESESGSGATESRELNIPLGVKFSPGGDEDNRDKAREDLLKKKKADERYALFNIKKKDFIKINSESIMKKSLAHNRSYGTNLAESESKLSKKISAASVDGNLTRNGMKVNKIKGLDLYGKKDNGSNSGGKNLKIKYLATKPSVIENSVPALDLTVGNDVIKSYIEDAIDNNIHGYSDELLAYSIGYYTLIKFKNTEDEMDEDIIPNVKKITVNKISATGIGDCFDEGIRDASSKLDLQGIQKNIDGSVEGSVKGIKKNETESEVGLMEGRDRDRSKVIEAAAEGATVVLLEFSNEIIKDGDQETKLAMGKSTEDTINSTVQTMVDNTGEEDFQAVMEGSITAIDANSSSEEQKETLKAITSASAQETANKKGYDTEETSKAIENAGGSVSKDKEELSFILLYDEEKFIDIDQNEEIKNPNDVPYLGEFTLDTDTGKPTKIKLNTSPNMLKDNKYNSLIGGKYKTFKFDIEGLNVIKKITVEIYKSPYIDIYDFNVGDGESLNYKIAENTKDNPIYIDSDRLYFDPDYENSYRYLFEDQDTIIYRYDVKDDDKYLRRKTNDSNFTVARDFKLKFKFKDDDWVDITEEKLPSNTIYSYGSPLKYFEAGFELPIGSNHFEIGFEINVPTESESESDSIAKKTNKINEINNIILTYGKFNKYFVYKIEKDIINVDSESFEFTQSTDVKEINYTVQDVPEALTFDQGGIFNIPGSNTVNTIELNTTDKVVSYTPEKLVTDRFFINLVYKVNQPSQFRRFLEQFSSLKFSKELTVNVLEGSSDVTEDSPDVTVSVEIYEASDGSKSIDIFIVSNSYNKITFEDFDNIKDYFTNAGDIVEEPSGTIEKNGNTITSFTPAKSTESDYFQFNKGNDSIAVIFTFNINVSYKIEGKNLIITLKEKKGDINLSELGDDVDNIIKGSTINSNPIHGTLEYIDNNISKYKTSKYHDDNFYITKDSTQYNVIIEYQKEFEEYVEHDIHNFTIPVVKNNEVEFFLDGNYYEILSDLGNREELKGTVSQTSTSNSGMPNYKFVPEGDFEGLTNLYLTDGYYTYYITFIVLEDTARYKYYNVLIDSEIEIAIDGNEYSDEVVLNLGSYEDKIYTANKIQSSRDILSYTDSNGKLYIAEISTTEYIFETVELGDDNSVTIDFKGIVESVTNGSITINDSKITFTPTSEFENNRWSIEYKYTSSKGNWIYVIIDIIEGSAKEIVDEYFIKINENELGLVEDNLIIDQEYTLASNYTLFIRENQVMATSQNFNNNGVIKLEKNGYLIIRDDTVFINNNEISPFEDKNSLVDSNNDGFIIKSIENRGKLQNDGTIIINYTFKNIHKTPFAENINGKFINNGTFRVNSDFENLGTVENSGSFESKNRIISFQQSPPNNGIFIKKITTGTFTYPDKKFVDGSFDFEFDFNDEDNIAKRKVVKKEEDIIVGQTLEVDYRNQGITNPQHGTVRRYGDGFFYYEPYNTKVEKTDKFSYKAREESPHYIIKYTINIIPDKVYLEVDSDEQVLLKDIPTNYSVESSPQKGSLLKDTDNKVYYKPSINEFVIDEFSLSIEGEIIKFSITIYKINISKSELEVSFGSTVLLDNIVADNYQRKSNLNYGELVELDGEVFYNPNEDKIQTDKFILKSGKNRITFTINIKREYNLEITNNDFSITEGNELTLNLRLNKPAEENFSITYTTTDDTASILDYNTSGGNVKFNSGDSDQEKSISLKTLDDYYLEDNEKFKIKFTSNKIEEIEKEITILDKKEVNLLNNITSDITIKNTQIFTILDDQDVNLKKKHKIIIEDGGKLNVNGTLFVEDGEVTMENGGLINVNDDGLINVGTNGKLKATSLNNNGTIENNLGLLSFNHLSNNSKITSYGNLRFDNKKVDVNFTGDSIIETELSTIVPTILPDSIIYDVNKTFRIFDGEIYIIDKNFILPKNFSIFIDSGGELIVNENILLQVDGTVTNEGKITNNGFIIFSSSGNFLNYFLLNDGEVTNNGSFYYEKDDFGGNVSGNDIIKTFEINSTNITLGGKRVIGSDTTFINLGKMTLDGKELENNGTFINFGTIIGTLKVSTEVSNETLKENNLLTNKGLYINMGLINYFIKIVNDGKFINYGYINDNVNFFDGNAILLGLLDVDFVNNGITNNIGFIAPENFFNNHILINSGEIKKRINSSISIFVNAGIFRNYGMFEFINLYNGANSRKEVLKNGILINTGEINGSSIINFKKIFYTDTTRFNSNISNPDTDSKGNTVNGTYTQVNSPVILDGKSSGNITINDGETYVIDNNFTLLKDHTLTIELGGSLNVNKIFTNDGTITNNGILFNYGNIINLKSISNNGLIENNSSFISHEAINGPILGNDIEIYTISTGDISIKIDDGKIINNEINENFILREEHSILFNTPANLIIKDKVNFICYGNINISDSIVFDSDTSPSMLIDNKGTIINYGNNNEFNFAKEFLNDGTFINNGNITVSVKDVPDVTDGPDVIVTLQNDDIINIKLRNSDNGVLTASILAASMLDYNDTFDKDQIKSASIIENVTSIGNYAFYGYTNLKNVSIPNSVTSIGEEAFGSCYGLENVNIPDSVTSIGNKAFGDCINLDNVSIPDSVNKIGESLFFQCSKLETVSIPNSVTSIGRLAFYFCSSLETVSIPDSVTSIGYQAFKSCDNLETVNMSNRITSDNINSEAFVSCTKLTTVNLFVNNNLGINETVKRDFFGAKNVNVKVNANVIVKLLNVQDTINITLQDGVLGKIGDYDNITDITQIESVSIKGNVTKIDVVAFSGCTNLKEMIIPDSVTFIGNGAFYNCTSLETLNIPDSVTSIGESAFYNCTSLKTVNIPDSVTSIGDYAFDGCTSISTLDINNALVGQNYKQGEGVPGFVYKFFKDSILSIKYITIGSSVTSIGEYAFFSCTSLETVEIPDTVTRISKAAFLKCSSLKEMIIPDSVTSIGETAFSECTSLETLSIPNSVTEIGVGAFDNCKIVTLFINTQLVSEKYNNTIFKKRGFIGEFFINSRSFLNNITIGDSVTSIGEQAFFVCPFLKTVSIPDSVKTIGFGAFSGCIRLETVSIPDSVTSIGDSAFEECTSLKTVSMGNSVASIADEAFIFCISLKTVSIPENNELGIIKTETRDFFGATNVEVIVNRLSFKNNLFINNHIINFKNINLDNNNNGNIRNNGIINCDKAIINSGDIKNGISAEIKVNNKTDSFDESFINCGTIINDGQITLENKKFRNESEKVIRNYGTITTKGLKNSGTIYSFNTLANLTGNSVIPKYNLTVEKLQIFSKIIMRLVLEPKAEEEISIKYSGSSIGTVYNDNITIEQGENEKILEIEIPERKNSGEIYITNFSELRGVNSIVNKDSGRLVSKNFVEVGHTTFYEEFIINDDLSTTVNVYELHHQFSKNFGDGKLVYSSSKGLINGLGQSLIVNKNKWEEPIIVRSDFIDQEVKYFIRKAKNNETDVDKFIKISGETFLLTANNFKPIAVRFFAKKEFKYIINFDNAESISINDAGYLLLLQSYTNVFDLNRRYNIIESKFSCYWLSSSGEIMNDESLIIGSYQIGIAEQFFGVKNVKEQAVILKY